MNIKKAQSSMEFMIILVFVLFIMMVAMYVSGKYLVEISDNQNEQLIGNYAEKINDELQILSKVEPGYERTLVLTNQDYNLTLINSNVDGRPSMLKLVDQESNTTHYYDLIGNYNLDSNYLQINLTKQFDTELNLNTTVLTFKKLSKTTNQGLDLLNT